MSGTKYNLEFLLFKKTFWIDRMKSWVVQNKYLICCPLQHECSKPCPSCSSLWRSGPTPPYFWNEKKYERSPGVETTRLSRAFQILKTNGFLAISWHQKKLLTSQKQYVFSLPLLTTVPSMIVMSKDHCVAQMTEFKHQRFTVLSKDTLGRVQRYDLSVGICYCLKQKPNKLSKICW